jgi:hypothetical protein
MKEPDMDWQNFESKLLASSAYDDGKHILYLRFRSGEVYRYFEFPADRYRPLLLQPCSESIPLRAIG